MAVDLNKGYVTKSGLIVTPKGRMIYPGVFTASVPKGETDKSKAAYQLTLLFPPAADLTLLTKAVADKIEETWGKGPYKFKIKRPFIKVEEQPRLAEFAEAYPVMIRAGNTQKPAAVFANLSPVEDETEVYGGRWATMSVNVYTWDHPTGGRGVSFGLNHVMVLDHDEPMGGGRVRVEDAFEAVEGPGGAPASADSMFG